MQHATPPPVVLILETLAFVLFLVGAYLSTTLGERLTRAAFACLVLAWMI